MSIKCSITQKVESNLSKKKKKKVIIFFSTTLKQSPDSFLELSKSH